MHLHKKAPDTNNSTCEEVVCGMHVALSPKGISKVMVTRSADSRVVFGFAPFAGVHSILTMWLT
jgi:hypothetical protein